MRESDSARGGAHGAVTHANAHPHLDCSGSIAVIHNGIVENFGNFETRSRRRAYPFARKQDSSDAHLIEDERASGARWQEALERVFARLDGLGAVIVLDLASNRYATKRTSPLVVGRNCSKVTIASDEIARRHATEIHYLEDGEVANVASWTEFRFRTSPGR
ncbi:MAG: hypothetical protein R2855_10810 [Thermomicrobiales bacterium]